MAQSRAFCFLLAVNISQVQQHVTAHSRGKLVQAQSAKLVPFGDDYDGVGAIRHGFGGSGELDRRK
jgi:hypothetical protein